MPRPEPLRPDEVEALLAAATAAASVLNTQPWIFDVSGTVIDLHADRGRHLHVIDPDGRQLLMSCGCALLNLRLAVAAMTREPVVDLFPDAAADDLVARVRVGRARVASVEESRLAAVIPRRRTNRRPFSPEQPSGQVLESLRVAAEAEGASVIAPSAAEVVPIAELVHEADRRQHADLAVRSEVARWTQPVAGPQEGLPPEALGPVPRGREAVTRDFGFGRVAYDRSVSDFEDRPTLLLIGTTGDDPTSWVAAGQAMERVQLTATSLGLATSFLGQVLEVADVRAQLRELVPGAGIPQMLARVGFAADSPPTPRRPVDAVLRSRRGLRAVTH